MYRSHATMFHNRWYNSRSNLKKTVGSNNASAKIVAFSVVLSVLTASGLFGIVIIALHNQRSTDNKFESLALEKQDKLSSANITDALAMDINALKDELVQLNDVWKKQFSSLSNNQSESRDYLETLNNLVELLEKKQNSSDIASRDNNRQLQTLNETLVKVQETQEASVDGGWSSWLPWGSCSTTCGMGLQRRERNCTNPTPTFLGDHCFGDDKDYRTCFERACNDGGWSAWSNWGSCSQTDDPGLQTRTRTCTNPSPSQFGRSCLGTDEDKQLCNVDVGE